MDFIIALLIITAAYDAYSLPTANLCRTPNVIFDQPPNVGSLNYAGILSLQSVPKNGTDASGMRGACECTLEGTEEGQYFSVMLKARAIVIDDVCLQDQPGPVCADRLEIDYTTSAGVKAKGKTVISQESWKEDRQIEAKYTQHVTHVKLRYTDEPDEKDFIHQADLEVIATTKLQVSCRYHHEMTEALPKSRTASNTKGTAYVEHGPTGRGRKASEKDSSGGLIVTCVVVAVVSVLIILVFAGILIYSKTRNKRKQSPGGLADSARYRNDSSDQRYVSLETMQKNNVKFIDDADESISFGAARNSATAVHQNNRAVTLDMSASAGSGNGAYEYIETVDYFQQAGSEPTSPESAQPSAQTSTNDSARMGDGSTTHATPGTCPSSFTDRVLRSNEYENLERSDSINENTENVSQNTYVNLPTGVQNANNLLVEPTKENGYGQGAIPKRPKESYYALWGERHEKV